MELWERRLPFIVPPTTFPTCVYSKSCREKCNSLAIRQFNVNFSFTNWRALDITWRFSECDCANNLRCSQNWTDDLSTKYWTIGLFSSFCLNVGYSFVDRGLAGGQAGRCDEMGGMGALQSLYSLLCFLTSILQQPSIHPLPVGGINLSLSIETRSSVFLDRKTSLEAVLDHLTMWTIGRYVHYTHSNLFCQSVPLFFSPSICEIIPKLNSFTKQNKWWLDHQLTQNLTCAELR